MVAAAAIADPRTLYLPDPENPPPITRRYFVPVACGAMGFTMGIITNNSRGRPYFAGLQKHIGFTIIGFVFGSVFRHYRDRFYEERDRLYRHYVELHPEDFPPPERKKFAEILHPWTPIR